MKEYVILGPSVVILEEEDCRNTIAFNSLYLFSLGLLSMKQMARHCIIHAWSDCQLPTYP